MFSMLDDVSKSPCKY